MHFSFCRTASDIQKPYVLRPLLGRWDLLFVHQRQHFNKLDRTALFKTSLCHLKNKQVEFGFLFSLSFKEQEEHPLVYRGPSATGRKSGALKQLAVQRASAQPRPLPWHRACWLTQSQRSEEGQPLPTSPSCSAPSCQPSKVPSFTKSGDPGGAIGSRPLLEQPTGCTNPTVKEFGFVATP